DFWCISARTAAPEAAASLVDFLLNDPRAVEVIGLTLGVPPSQAARDLLGAEPDSAAGRAIAYVEEPADRVGPPPPAWPVGRRRPRRSWPRRRPRSAERGATVACSRDGRPEVRVGRVTLREVADRAGVSLKTVTNVVHQRS